MRRISIICVATLIILVLTASWFANPIREQHEDHRNEKGRIPVVFSAGHETNPVDHGRPVALIGPALGVDPEVFRKAFRNVRPAPGGTAPDRKRVMENKRALMKVLAPHRVTNERLDAVSDYYRYNRGRGEMWPTEPAVAHALLENGVVTGFEISTGGSGYSSPPTISVPGVRDFDAKVQLSFSQQFDRNGSVTAITLLSD